MSTSLARLIALLVLFAPALSFASTPGLSHHGRLLDATDQPVNGVLDVTFTLYDAPSAGNELWSEVWSVTSVNGYYSVLLGGPDGDPPNPINPAQLDRQLFLGIRIADGPELQPRQVLGASVYALRAAVADSVVGGRSRVSPSPAPPSTRTH